MTDPQLSRVLAAGVELLTDLVRERAEPGDALARVDALARRAPGVDIDVVWERPDVLGDRHYDLLIRRGERTISLSVCAAADVPWAMRGVTRGSEKDVLRVNGEAVNVAEAIAALDVAWRELDVATQLVDQALLRQLVARRAVPGGELGIGPDGAFVVEPGELEVAFDEFRLRHGLESSEALSAWLERRGWTFAQLEGRVRAVAVRDRVRRAVTADAVEPHFAAYRHEYDRVDVLRVGPLGDDDVAELRRSPGLIHVVAERAFLRDPAVAIGHASYARHQLAPAMASALFGTPIGHVAGPFDREMARVLRVSPAVLDHSMRRVVEERLFAEWLAEQRRDAEVEWMWAGAAGA